MNIPRSEHPKPQFMRSGWRNLNGPWAYELDNGRSGVPRGLAKPDAHLSGVITVPFCPQSQLSGVGHKDFIYRIWYQKIVSLTEQDLKNRVVLHFGAADYETHVFVNGTEIGHHKGGYVSFSFDITSALQAGDNVLTVYCDDDERNRLIPRGKQCESYNSVGCDYTRTTGIWQTVWLEFTPRDAYIEGARYVTNIYDNTLTAEVRLHGAGTLTLVASFEGKEVGRRALDCRGGVVTVTLPLSERHLWDVGQGDLYDLTLTYARDTVSSYFGMRAIRFEGKKWMLNDRSVFQRLVLDQGFYPDGIYTAPSDEALQNDIRLSLAAGFNGARLHQKIFEERFLYHCDRMGYLVWGEFPDWGLDHTYADNIYGILPEWIEEVNRDFNHPAIIGWCPHNETWNQRGREQFNDALSLIWRTTKALDATRPCIDTSGNFHVETDIFDVHDYEQDPAVFKANYDKLMQEGILHDRFAARQQYAGQPVFVSEYGGIGWSVGQGGWGYGDGPKTEEEFLARYRGLTDALLDNSAMFALCYTQLTDVEQEQNGLYTYDRKPKFDTAVLHKIMSRKAAIED